MTGGRPLPDENGIIQIGEDFVLIMFFATLRVKMPRRDFLTLDDFAATSRPTLSIVCEPCGRCDWHDVADLTRSYGGEVKLPELLSKLVAECPKWGTASVYDRCRAVYGRESRARPFTRA
jgi:hypothetical protein